MAGKTHEAKFVLVGEDRTKAATAAARRNFEHLTRSLHSMTGAFTGLAAVYGLERLMRSVTDTEIKIQSMRYTLEAATGSMSAANQEMQFVVNTSDRLGISIKSVGEYYSRMAAIATDSGYSLKAFHQEFVNISGAMRVLHLDTRHTQLAWLALQEIMAQGTVKMRHLTRQLSIDFPTALQAMALGLGKTTGQLLEMAHAGKLLSKDAIEGLSKGTNMLYGPQISAAAKGLQADLQRVGNAFLEAVAAADKTGVFDTFGEAMNRLAATIKDPSFQQGFSSLIIGLVKLADWSARAGSQVIGTLTKLTDFATGISAATSGWTGTTATALGAKIQAWKKDIADLTWAQREYEKGALAVKPPDLTEAQQTRLANLRLLVANAERQLAEGRAKAFESLQESATTAGGHHPTVEQMTVAQQQALSKLSSMADSLLQKIDGFKKSEAIAQGLLGQFKPGSKAYSEAAALVKIIGQESAQVDKLTAAKKRAQQASRDEAAEQKKEAAAAKERIKWLQQERDWVMQLIDPTYQLRKEQVRLDMDYEAGAINATQYRQALESLQGKTKDTGTTMNQFLVQGLHNIQNIMAGTFTDVFTGATDTVGKFGDAIKNMVINALAQFAALKTETLLFGQAFASGQSTSVGGLIGQAIGWVGGHARGGMVGAAAERVAMPLAAFARAPSFDVGGFPGLAPPGAPVPIVAHVGEEVLARNDPRNRLNGGRSAPAIHVHQQITVANGGNVSRQAQGQIAAAAYEGAARAARQLR